MILRPSKSWQRPRRNPSQGNKLKRSPVFLAQGVDPQNSSSHKCSTWNALHSRERASRKYSGKLHGSAFGTRARRLKQNRDACPDSSEDGSKCNRSLRFLKRIPEVSQYRHNTGNLPYNEYTCCAAHIIPLSSQISHGPPIKFHMS
jgi:hypothetical protein